MSEEKDISAEAKQAGFRVPRQNTRKSRDKKSEEGNTSRHSKESNTIMSENKTNETSETQASKGMSERTKKVLKLTGIVTGSFAAGVLTTVGVQKFRASRAAKAAAVKG